MYVGIVPHELRKTKKLGSLQISQLHWPNQQIPPYQLVNELGKDDHIVVYPCSNMLWRKHSDLACKVNLLLAEPKCIHKKYYQLMWLLKWKFNLVFTRYQASKKNHANITILPVVDSWVTPDPSNQKVDKTALVSLIASAKADQPGHKLRHKCVEYIKHRQLNVDILGRGYKPFENKEDGLLKYNFSIVIENIQETDYFSEKLLDSMLCYTIPIYWGCPNIDEYFNPEGIIICQTEESVYQAIENICNNETIISNEMKEAMEENATTATHFSDLNSRIQEKIILSESRNIDAN